ncbi:hypothetical protein Cni_G20406 [Canna indica]|uniref:ZCF37 n=1 Tax=Canna indica TaxID=4628 RepID=A0AAQ3KTP6_9LILI|nr:hypothetical protein Cni_G20406 [Canna indica]
MFCGTGSFKSVDSDPWSTPPSSPKPTKKKAAATKNPYSARGRDKFSALLSELEARRAKIIATAGGSQGVAMVRFTCSSSDDWIPIVIKIRDEDKPRDRARSPPPAAAKLPSSEEIAEKPRTPPEVEEMAPATVLARKRKERFCWTSAWKSVRLNCLCWPPLVVLLMLLCLVVFGRVFAICCTTVWWYLLPLMECGERGGMSLRRPTKKKDYGRRLSSKKPIRGAQLHHHSHQEVAASSPRGGHGNEKRA